MESSFQTAICECPDINANTLAVDRTGRYVVISGRKSMGLIDLTGKTGAQDIAQAENIPSEVSAISSKLARTNPTYKRLVRNAKYDPTASQFNGHMTDLFALTTNQVVEIFSIEDLNPLKPKILLRGHSRVIADVEWSHFDPHMIGSSAADCLTNLWDIRDSRRPSASLTSVSGATLIRFCKTSSNLLATSHEIDVRIWDIRQPNLPLYYIAAHLQKINGMDWNPRSSNCDQQLEQLITCSQDNTVKLWDICGNKVRPHANLPTRSPAWRIRYTPVSSNAILTSTIPQLRSRSESMALKLWSIKSGSYEQKKLELILGLIGHTDVVIDFGWRSNPQPGACEIITWAKDQTLRVWHIDNQFIELNVENSDLEAECEAPETPCDPTTGLLMNNGSQKNSKTLNDEIVKLSLTGLSMLEQPPKQEDPQPDAINHDDDSFEENLSSTNELRQEFNLMNKNIPNIDFEELNPTRRVCLVTARAKNVTCRLRVALPHTYPSSDCPTFTIIDSNQYGGESLNKEAKEKLLNLLDETAKAQLSRSRNCIEPCLRKFIAMLQKITNYGLHKRRGVKSGLEQKDDPISISAQRDHSVPFPPTSGARFCGNLLVCFGRPMLPTVNTSSENDSANWLVETPRSLAQLSAQLENMRRQGYYNLPNISISYFYYGAMRSAGVQNRIGLSASSTGRTSSRGLQRGRSMPHSSSLISKNYKCGPVLVYDVSMLLGPLCRELADSYVFDKDVIKMCRRNAEIAATFNRRDLVQTWSLAELSSEGVLRSHIPNKESSPLLNYDSDFGDRPWTMHPFGSKLIQSLIDHYVYNCHDVQTAAMLIWTFSSSKLGPLEKAHNSKSSKCKSSYQNMLPSVVAKSKPSNNDGISGDWSFVSGKDIQTYSNSWSNSTTNILDQLESQTSPNQEESYKQMSNRAVDGEMYSRLNILIPERSLQNDLIMHVYAELLYRLNLLNQRAMVLKNIGSASAYLELFGDHQAINSAPEERLTNLTIQCYNIDCRNKCRSAQCPNCKKYSLYCSICRLPVRGSCSICSKCLHGGHVSHFDTWFQTFEFCPTGCGCRCLATD